jgi:hypothetical protein
MNKFLVYSLIITGVGALIAMGKPELIIFGLFLLVIPGLIMLIMPTVFIYLLVFSVTWAFARPFASAGIATVLTSVIVLTFFTAIPMLANMSIRANIAADRGEEVDAPTTISLRNVVRIESYEATFLNFDDPEAIAAREQSPDGRAAPLLACNSLCAAVLFTPGVDAVVMASLPKLPRGGTRAAQAFHIDRTPGCTPLVDIYPHWSGFPAPQNAEALQREWRKSVSSGDCIVRSEEPLDPSIVIALTFEYHASAKPLHWTLTGPYRNVTRFSISESGDVVLSRAMVETQLNSVPLRISFGSGFELRLVPQLARNSLRETRRVGFFNPTALLAEHTNIVLEPTDRGKRLSVRQVVSAALRNPSRQANDPAFGLAALVLNEIGSEGVQDGDLDLIKRLIADPRMRDFRSIWRIIRRLGPESISLRDPIVARLREDPVSALGMALSSLPAGIFAELTADELALLTDPERRSWAPGLIERQTDRGPAAAVFLLDMLEDILQRRSLRGGRNAAHLESAAEKAIQHALAVLGSDITAHRSRLEAILVSRTDRAAGAQFLDWEVPLIRMGAPVEQFEPYLNRPPLEQYHTGLRRAVTAFESQLRDKR